jgi:hypothetical protein
MQRVQTPRIRSVTHSNPLPGTQQQPPTQQGRMHGVGELQLLLGEVQLSRRCWALWRALAAAGSWCWTAAAAGSTIGTGTATRWPGRCPRGRSCPPPHRLQGVPLQLAPPRRRHPPASQASSSMPPVRSLTSAEFRQSALMSSRVHLRSSQQHRGLWLLS